MKLRSSVLLAVALWSCGGSSNGESSEPTTGDSGTQAPTDAGENPEADSGASSSNEASADERDTGSEHGTGEGSDAGAAGDGGTCRPQFASGVNVAWINFASDVPIQSGELAKFDSLFANVYAAGGRAVRWWFHTNGTVTPGYDSSGVALPVSTSNIDDLKTILDHAHAAGVGVIISLWSFDMLQAVGTENITETLSTNNKNLLSADANRTAYVNNVLTPLVTALKGYPGLLAWETFNEPEGMTVENGWVPESNRIEESVVQKCVNTFAAAIHAADPTALVTNGTWTFIANSNVAGYTNDYSDTALLSVAGAQPGGTLDFYEVHYYDNWGPNGSANGASVVVSPFTHPASYWATGDTKPIVIGEFHAIDTNGIPAANLYTTLYDGGYGGAWAWQYEYADNPPPSIDVDGQVVSLDATTPWPAMQAPMQNLYGAHPSAVTCP
jgi:Cellulase (glycosyl hydrolase family 5)